MSGRARPESGGTRPATRCGMYASLRCACGDDMGYTAHQLGHEGPRLTLRVYAQAAKRRDRLAPAKREAFDRALQWALMATSGELERVLATAEATENPA